MGTIQHRIDIVGHRCDLCDVLILDDTQVVIYSESTCNGLLSCPNCWEYYKQYRIDNPRDAIVWLNSFKGNAA